MPPYTATHVPQGHWPSSRQPVRAAVACLGLLLGACSQAPPAGTPPGALASADPARGPALLAQHQCGACHVIPAVPGAAGRSGPTLAHFGRRSYIAGAVPNTPELLQRWLQDPPALVPGTTMPALGVSPEAARDMAAWLLELK